MRISVSGRADCTASGISLAVVTGTVRTKGTGSRAVGPEISVTSAPRSMASRAISFAMQSSSTSGSGCGVFRLSDPKARDLIDCNDFRILNPASLISQKVRYLPDNNFVQYMLIACGRQARHDSVWREAAAALKHGNGLCFSLHCGFYAIMKPAITYPTNDSAVTIPMYGSCATA